MDKNLASVIKYFAIFDYFPSFDDIYTFFPKKISKKQLKTLIEDEKYTIGEYSKTKFKVQSSKFKTSKEKLSNWRFRTYVKLLSFFPQIKLVGLSGSIAMMNASKDDDVDLFIITAKNRLWTGRFLAVIIAYLMGLKRKKGLQKAPNKVCLNLFFDESNLVVLESKKTEFVAHEVLQMKPIINKGNAYERFLKANEWVFMLFPNAKSKVKNQKSKFKFKSEKCFKNFKLLTLTSNFIESIFKKAQLFMINRHRTTEIVTSTQLWFHPVDFRKKIYTSFV